MMGRKLRRAGILAVAVICGPAAILILATGFGPSFPDEPLGIRPPQLSVESAACYEAERHRVLLVAPGGELRFTWNPPDGVGRIRLFGAETQVPEAPGPGLFARIRIWLGLVPPAGTKSPALVMLMDAGAVGFALPDRDQLGAARVYLGGLGPEGEIRAVPFQGCGPVCARLSAWRDTLVPHDFYATPSVELRIGREGDRVTYRWGPMPGTIAFEKDGRFSWGRAEFTAGEVAGVREGVLLPDLAARLRGPFVVFLEHGTGVRYVDILRAVECAGGDPTVLFLEYPFRAHAALDAEVLRPPPEGVSLLIERHDLPPVERTHWAWIQDEGCVKVKGMWLMLDEFEREIGSPQRARVLFGGGPGAAWGDFAPYLQVAVRQGADVCFGFPPIDPALRIDTVFPVPIGSALDANPIDVTIPLEEAGIPAEVDERPVWIRVRDAAVTVQEVVNVLMRLRLAGATGFVFG